MIKNIKVIAFDADDTLWESEIYFRETEQKFCNLLETFCPAKEISEKLFQTEMDNLSLYGFGAKSFILSLIETANLITDNNSRPFIIEEIIKIGKELLQHPLKLLDGVEQLLSSLAGKYKLVLATKGDLLEQETKLQKSKLEQFFHHIEIMSDKREENYIKLISHLDILPCDFLMIGNSVKSDVIPVLNVNGHAIHVPYHTNWNYELVAHSTDQYSFHTVENILQILNII